MVKCVGRNTFLFFFMKEEGVKKLDLKEEVLFDLPKIQYQLAQKVCLKNEDVCFIHLRNCQESIRQKGSFLCDVVLAT